MADWPRDPLMAWRGIIASSCCYSAGFFIGSGLHHVPFALGPVYLPPDTGNDERLLTEQYSHPNLGVLVLVQNLAPFSGSTSLND